MILIVILGIGFVVYKLTLSPVKVQNSAGGAQTENPEIQTPAAANNSPTTTIQAQADDSSIILSVCRDKCGDGICQKIDPNCTKEDQLNCICPETPKECPQDCK